MEKDIEVVIRNTKAIFLLSGFVLSDEDINRIRLFAYSPEEAEKEIARLVNKHSVGGDL